MKKLVIAVLLLAACGDDDAGDPSQYVAVDAYKTANQDAWCTYYARCGYFPDHATCMSANVAITDNLDAQLVASIKAGRIFYNGNNARTCLDAIANATCDKTDEAGRVPPRACRELFRGTLSADAACFTDAECISADCQVLVADETCGASKCRGNTPPSMEPAPNGSPCGDYGCAAGSFCDPATYTCETLRGTGMMCTTTADCAFGLGCAGNPRTCKPLPAMGEPCPEGVCRDDGARCTTSGCVAIGLAGATCQSSVECSQYYPCDFSTMQCKRLPMTGESCTSGNTRCFDQSYCDSSTLECIPYRGVGEICSASLQCSSGQCDFTTNECVEAAACL